VVEQVLVPLLETRIKEGGEASSSRVVLP
jgi:hypothetical protein